jgi:hypothetical protein
MNLNTKSKICVRFLFVCTKLNKAPANFLRLFILHPRHKERGVRDKPPYPWKAGAGRRKPQSRPDGGIKELTMAYCRVWEGWWRRGRAGQGSESAGCPTRSVWYGKCREERRPPTASPIH